MKRKAWLIWLGQHFTCLLEPSNTHDSNSIPHVVGPHLSWDILPGIISVPPLLRGIRCTCKQLASFQGFFVAMLVSRRVLSSPYTREGNPVGAHGGRVCSIQIFVWGDCSRVGEVSCALCGTGGLIGLLITQDTTPRLKRIVTRTLPRNTTRTPLREDDTLAEHTPSMSPLHLLYCTFCTVNVSIATVGKC